MDSWHSISKTKDEASHNKYYVDNNIENNLVLGNKKCFGIYPEPECYESFGISTKNGIDHFFLHTIFIRCNAFDGYGY